MKLRTGIRDARRRQREKRPGLRDGDIRLFDTRVVKWQVFDRVGHFLDDILTVGEELHTLFHHGRYIRSQNGGRKAKEKGKS